MNGLKVITVENGKASTKDMIQDLRDVALQLICLMFRSHQKWS